MIRFLVRYAHWVTLVSVLIVFSMLLVNFTYSLPDIIAAVFGVIGVLFVISLAIFTEMEVRKRKQGK